MNFIQFDRTNAAVPEKALHKEDKKEMLSKRSKSEPSKR
jgi:hypothetical protein